MANILNRPNKTAKFLVGVFALTFMLSMTVQPLVFSANAVVGSVTINTPSGSGTGPYNVSGTWQPQGNQCWTNGQGFHYFINVFEDINSNASFNSGIDSILQIINPASCNGYFSGTVPNDGSRGMGGNWPAIGQSPNPATFNLSPGSHSLCAVLMHVNNNGNDIVATSCLDNPVVVPPTPVPGCMDSEALNYNPEANEADGSCIYNGTLTVTKNTFGGNGTFGFSLSNEAGGFEITTTDGNGEKVLVLPPGEYSVSEISLPNANWSQTSNNCTSIVIVSQGSADCTIVNTYTTPDVEPGAIKVVKTTNTDGTFSFFGDGFEGFDIITGDFSGFHVISSLIPGIYTVNESNPGANWSTDNGCENIEVFSGETSECLITNTYTAPEPDTASLTIKKLSYNWNESTLDGAFTFDGDLDSFGIETNDGEGSETFSNLEPDVYNIYEIVPEGWDLSTIYCDTENYEYDGNDLYVELNENDEVICTFVNYADQPQNEPEVDLELTKDVSDQTVDTNQEITYTVNVINHGPDTANNVKVTDALPVGLEFVSASATQGGYDENTNIWDIGTMNDNDTVTLTMVVKVTATSGTIINEAAVDLDPNIDINSDNNSDSIGVSVNIPEGCQQNCEPQCGEECVESTPTPTPTPPGGGGGCFGNCGGFVPTPTPTPSVAPTPTPEVLGATDNQPEVLGATLPETGFSVTENILMSLFMAFAVTGMAMMMIGLEIAPKAVLRKLEN